MDVDILLWGGTHRFEAFEMEGRFFVNPGSATGAFSTGYFPEGQEPVPSFCLMDVSLRLSSFVFRLLLFSFFLSSSFLDVLANCYRRCLIYRYKETF